jgi:hypothetical protein
MTENLLSGGPVRCRNELDLEVLMMDAAPRLEGVSRTVSSTVSWWSGTESELESGLESG